MDRIKYITNKDLLAEIHRSKISFCHFEREEYARFDAIVASLDELTPEFIQATLDAKLALVAKKGPAAWAGAVPDGPTTTDALVFRVMTDEHIPQDEGPKRRKRPNGSTAVRTVFPPFKHYVIRDGEPIEVGRSHWLGSISNGEFNGEHGRISTRLAQMFMLLVERYSRRGNWRGYSYVDEMRSHALLQLSQIGLQFDESKSDNPFAFFTQCIKNCFTRILNVERKNQHIRDDLLVIAGVAPSFTRQIDHELDQRFGDQKSGIAPAAAEASETAPVTILPSPAAPKKRGRKPKVLAA